MTLAHRSRRKRIQCIPFFILAFAITAPAGFSFAQTVSSTPRPEFWVTDGHINAMVESCGRLYIGGSFGYVAPYNAYTGSFAAIDAASGLPDPSLSKTNGSVFAVASDDAGGWYIGGSFTSVGGVTRNRIAHILAGGALDADWDPNATWSQAASVRVLVVSGNTVYAAGFFDSIGGQARNYLAALDRTTGLAMNWNPNPSDRVSALAVSGNIVYVGGGFISIGGQPRAFIAALDATTGWATAWNPNAPTGLVLALAVSDGTVYAGGQFTSIGGQPRNYIAALNVAPPGLATTWNPNAGGGDVSSLAVSGSTVYVGGSFTSIGGQPRNRIAAIDTDGLATAWNPNANATSVTALAVSNGVVYAGGNFTFIGGQTRNFLAALDATGATTTWNPNPNLPVRSLAVSGNTVSAGGDFTSIGGQYRGNIAALDVVTGAATDWNPGANSDVYALAVSGNTVYAGGAFTSVGGQSRNYIAALDTTLNTNNATTWNPNADYFVYALAVPGSTIYAGGQFTSIGGQSRSYFAALDAAPPGMATLWNPNSNGIVRALAVSDSTVYAGGDFDSIGGQSRNNIAALDATINTINATSWNPNAGGGGSARTVSALVVSGSTVYAGGHFTSIGGQSRSFIAALNATIPTNNAMPWNPSASADVRALAVSDSTVYAGGDFTSIGGVGRNYFAALDATLNTNNATSWNPNADNIVRALSVSYSTVLGSTVYGGGDFTSIGGQPRNSLAGFSLTNSVWSSGSGFWNNAANWNPAVVPDNSGCDQFNVRIGGATANVTLDIDPTINSLRVEDGGMLGITNGSTAIVTFDGVTNDANLTISNGQAIIAAAPMSVTGSQPVVLDNGRLSSSDAANTMTISTPVTGFGQIDAAFTCSSTIDANVNGQALEIGGSFSASSDGTLQASSGGTLLIDRSIIGSGAFVADYGTISIPGSTSVIVSGSTMNVGSGGTLYVSGQGRLSIATYFDIGGCTGLRGCTPPVLGLTGSSTTDVGGTFLCTGPVDLTVGAGVDFSLKGDFLNHSNSPSTFDWSQGPLRMTGSDPQSFELAGQDLGDSDPAGFIDNFAMGTLQIEPGATINFVNNFDNSPSGGCEVLYVDTLILGAGSTVNLNGCHIYYRHWQNGGATINLNGGDILSALIGDMNCDSGVSGADIQAFLLAITDPFAYAAAHPGCDINHADLDQSGTVDIDDVPAFVNYLLQGI